MFAREIKQNRFLLGYANTLVADLDDARLAEQPAAAVNHPAWILGHIAVTGDSTVAALGGAKVLPTEWTALLAGKSQPTTDRSAYPSKEKLLAIINERYGEAQRLAAIATAEQLAAPNNHPRLGPFLPEMGDLIGFLLTGHIAIHLGQLSMWRRLIGMPPLF